MKKRLVVSYRQPLLLFVLCIVYMYNTFTQFMLDIEKRLW